MDKTIPVLVAEGCGYELWAHCADWDDDSEFWEVTLDEEGDDYIGITTDTLEEATRHARQWLADTLEMERGGAA